MGTSAPRRQRHIQGVQPYLSGQFGQPEGLTKVVNSRYSIVMATAKRAREIIDGSMPLVGIKGNEKPLSVAIDELNQAKIKVDGEED